MNAYSKQELSVIGESIAATHLINSGYAVVCRNFRQACGEIDLIVEKDQRLIFCEVKTRTSHYMEMALASVAYTKQKKISKTAQIYINQNPRFCNHIFRFDVLVVFYFSDTDTLSVHHFEDAFFPIVEN
ncbi:MAG: YraN family protein [Candidatus Cloacimonetes bacterium]|nr:YraN family protein [Candidatus Cloacimonadota bacterium]